MSHHHRDWETELCVLQGTTRADLIRQCENLYRTVSASEPAEFLDITRAQNTGLGDTAYRLSIVADSLDDLGKKLQHSIERLKDPKRVRIKDKSGIYFFEEPLGRDGKLAFLFPGEGSQYVNMLSDVCLHFPEARSCFDLLDCAYADHPSNYRPSDFIFPPTDDIRAQAEAKIWQMDSAVDAVTTANRALLKVVRLFGIAPDAVVGHSSGEMAALEAAGAVELGSEQEVIHHIQAGNGVIKALEAANDIPQGRLLAVGGVDLETVSAIIGSSEDFLTLAMDNCPHQFVLCGTETSVNQVAKKLKKRGGICQHLSFKRAYHTQRFEPALEHLEKFFKGATFVTPRTPLYSCMTAGLYPSDPKAILRYALDQWARPVKFRQTVEAMHADGIRIFLELGPRGNLTAFVNDILKGKSFLAVASNVHHRPGLTQLNHALALLVAHGVPLNLSALYRHRTAGKINPAKYSNSDAQSSKGAVQLSLTLPMLNLDNYNPDGALNDSENRMVDRGQAADMPHRNLPSRGMKPAAVSTAHVKPQTSAPINKTPLSRPTDQGGRPSPRTDLSPNAMEEYFKTMDLFMDLQQQVMDDYLGPNQPSLYGAEKGVFPKDQCNGPVGSGGHNESVGNHINEAAAAPADNPVYDEKTIQNLLIACVSDKTGYPEDSLTLDQNLEADLGIDSIKRVEILGALAKHLDFLEQLQPEDISNLKTLGEITHFISSRSDDSASREAVQLQGRVADLRNATGQGAISPPLETLPFNGEVIRRVPGQETVIVRRLDLDEDLFLKHHTLGGRVSKYDDTLLALPIVPFSISSEIMAQAAAQLYPGKSLVGMKDLKAHDWIILENRRLTLQIIATAHPGLSEARTEIYIINPSGSQRDARLAMEGTMIFDDTYPQAPAAATFDPGTEIRELMPPQQFYPAAMFHGPSFRCVEALHRCGDNGLETLLGTPPKDQLFAGDSNPCLLSNPILLDGAGQSAGLWAAHCLETDFVVFPAELSEVRFYAAPSQDPVNLACRVQVELEGSDAIRSNIDLINSGGILFSRLKGLRHKRIHMSEILHRFRGSREIHLSEPWQAPLEALATADKLICRRLNPAEMDFSGPDGRVLSAVIAHIVLSRQERKIWNSLSVPDTQRHQWLLSRVVAKEAVCQLLEALTAEPVWPADIEIQEDPDSGLQVSGPGIGQTASAPLLSVDDAAGTFVAIAADAQGRSGVGIAARRAGRFDPALQKTVFDSKEIELISSLSKAESGEWLHRMRCAKKALAKAVGQDLISELNHISVQGLDIESGSIRLELSGNAVRRFPELRNKRLQAHTQRFEDIIIAIVLYTE
jgi:malonyl CoA-acyl carrier protein transacylase/acyl carrier protein/phosphopantetheinyl transferase (holo-ACP synthase)